MFLINKVLLFIIMKIFLISLIDNLIPLIIIINLLLIGL
jgi:hypothetical protein